MAPAIEAQGLTKTYANGVTALEGVDLVVPEGQVFGYLGRNGQGKSTTVRILTGLSLPTSGIASVTGLDVIAHRRDVQAKIGVTLQDVALDELQTAREHLVFVGSLWGLGHRLARRRAEGLLEEFGLADAAGRLIRSFSGGMRRRLDLATSLLNEPSVLFLDEPTTGLDPQSRRALWNRIRELRSHGATVFLTTQYLDEADELADRIAILDAGRIRACGTPAELRATHGVTRVGIRVTDPRTQDDLVRLFGVGAEAEAVDDWVRFEVSDPAEAARRVAHLGSLGVAVDELSVQSSSLEDVFVELTGSGINRDDAAGEPSGNAAPSLVEGAAA